MFSTVFDLIEPYLPSILFWIGPYRMRRQQKLYSNVMQYKNHQFNATAIRSTQRRYCRQIWDSPTLSSRILTILIRVLTKLLGHSLITWLLQEAVRSNLPGVSSKAVYKKCCVILGCTEVFIERPKLLINQTCT